MNSTGTHVA
jgi:hypothetical protein